MKREWWLLRERVSRGESDYVLIHSHFRPQVGRFDPETQSWGDAYGPGRVVLIHDGRCWRFTWRMWHRLSGLRLRPGQGPTLVRLRMDVVLAKRWKHFT